MADAERLSVATLAKLTASGDIAAAGRLGRSLIAEIEWRGRWTQAASDGAASSSTAIGVATPSAAVALPPDPSAWVYGEDGRTRLPLSDIVLPARGSLTQLSLLSALHAFCCEDAAASEQWEDVERHSRAGLSLLRSAGREGASYGKGVPPASSATGGASPRWVAWRQICFAFAALMAAQRLGSDEDGTASASAIDAVVASRRALLRQLRGYCDGASARTEDGTTIAPLLRVATAVAKEAIHADAASAQLSDDIADGLTATLRLASRHVERAASDVVDSLPLQSDGQAARGGDVDGAELPQRAMPGLRATLDRLHAALELRTTLAARDGNAETSRVHSPKRPRLSAHVRPLMQHVESSDGDGGDGTAACWAALLDCGHLAIALEVSKATRRGHTITAPESAATKLDAYLPESRITAAVDFYSNQSCRCDGLGALQRAVHASLHLRATFLLSEAVQLLLRRSSAHHAHPTASHDAAAAVAAVTTSNSNATDELLRSAERTARRAIAMLGEHDQGGGGGATLAAMGSRRVRATALLMLGQHTDAMEQLDALPAELVAAADLDGAVLRGILEASRGHAQGSLDAFQHSLAVGSGNGLAAGLPLYNLHCHYDRTRQYDAARRLSDFLPGADMRVGLNSADHAVLTIELAAARTAGTAVPGDARRPRVSAHASGGALCPLGTTYLQARARLLHRDWEGAAALLRGLLDQERQLRPVLHSLGLGEPDLVRQLALAMLEAGEHHELIRLLRERGLERSPHVSDLLADALLCDDEPHAALALVDSGAKRAPGDVARGGSGAAADGTRRRDELRSRNNRACYLVCVGRHAEAERELLAASKLAPAAVEPAYNLALLRWQVGEKRAAAEAWLRFRGWKLAATPDYYESLASGIRPSAPPSPPESAVSGSVDAASSAALDRAMLRYWSSMQNERAVQAHWSLARALEDETTAP